MNPKREDKTPQPLELNLYNASSENFHSENAFVSEFIADVYHKTNGEGIFTIDRGSDIRPLIQLEGKFVNRLKDQYLTDAPENKRIWIKTHIEKRDDLPFGDMLERRFRNGKRVPMRLRFELAKVSIPALDKQGIPHETTLVTAWSDKAKRPIEPLKTMLVATTQNAISVITN